MFNILKGKAHKFGDDINTDYVMASRNRTVSLNYKELAQFLMQDIKPGFFKEFKSGDFIVAGSNFGCGSSREYAARILKEGGCSAVIASSFARIFYRNAINVGLIPVECDTTQIMDKDQLEVDINKGVLMVTNRKVKININSIPVFVQKIIVAGGLVKYLKCHDQDLI